MRKLVLTLAALGLGLAPMAATAGEEDGRDFGDRVRQDLFVSAKGSKNPSALQLVHYDDDDDDDHRHRKHWKKHRHGHHKHAKKHRPKRVQVHEHYHYYDGPYGYYAPRRDRGAYRLDHDPYRPHRPSNYGALGPGFGRCNHELIGGVAGGGLGALVGSQIGKGSGNTVAIITGTLTGIVAGSGLGHYLKQMDPDCVAATLDYADDYQTIAWSDPAAGQRYEVTPVRSYETPRGEYCREYNTSVVIGGRVERAYGTACRRPDGDWELRS